MASLYRLDNRWVIQFMHPRRGRQSLRIGKVDKRTAENVKLHVERVVAAKISAQPVDCDTAAWLTKISRQLHERLAKVGLVESAARPQADDMTLDAFATQYIAGRAKLSERTILNLEGTQKRLVAVFGKHRTLRSISPSDADDLRETLLRKSYAPSTVATDIKRGRQFYKAAVKKGLVATNPFDEVKAGSQVNQARAFFVSRASADKVFSACPDNEWKLIFALSRFGGLRCPSETLNLRWADIDWKKERLHIRSKKTKARTIPLFPELRPFLEEAREQAGEGDGWVVVRHRGADCNLRTHMTRIIKAAGLAVWPRLFHNLRATRETELASEHPLHVVCEWIGNSSRVAREHYLQVTDEHFARALQNPMHQPPARGGKTAQGVRKARENPFCPGLRAQTVPPAGIEPAT